MPATNRGVGLAPAATTSPEYLNSLVPSWTTLVASLAVLALLFIIASRRRSHCPCSKTSARLIPTAPDQHDQHDLKLPGQPAWFMDEKQQNRPKGQHVSFKDEATSSQPLSIDMTWQRASTPRQIMSRPPPAPPLTPPELSTAVFTFEDRPHGNNDNFVQQANPDYIGSTSTSMSQSSSGSPPTPRRRSYTKTLPIGIPTPQTSSVSDMEPADLTFSPSSFPPTSPLLPPAPPGMDEDMKAQTQEIDVHGEIISVLDGDGAGWTRHTRVYGGGVCLACAASGGDHGGGFYGATVRPEEMR